MNTGWFVKANDIKDWTNTNKRRAEEMLPELVERLIRASCDEIDYIHFPSGDSVTARKGWDGELEVNDSNEYVPTNKSVWEFGTSKDAKGKAERDYEKRTEDPGNVNPKETTIIFVTSRTWDDKKKWCNEKNEEGIWKEVRGINADDLEKWLHQCPGVHRWFARIIGKKAEGIWDIEKAWDSWKHGTHTSTNSQLVLNGRQEKKEEILKLINGNAKTICVKANSQKEAYAFCLASLWEKEEFIPRVLIVNKESAWDFILDTQTSLILLPNGFIPENLGYANKKGHFVIIPRELEFPFSASKKIQIERMSREDRINALKSMDLSEEEAKKVYKDTNGYFGPIRRHEKLKPRDYIIPDWINKFDTNILVTALIATEWNNQKDKEPISCLADMSYDSFENQLLKLASVSDPPVRLVGDVWQVISKMDFWALISHKINKKIIERLEPIVIEVLGETNPVYDLPPGDRWKANIKGVTPKYSKKLKVGLADTLAILAVFGDDKCQNLGTIRLSDKIEYWVSELLNKDLSAKGWYSLGQSLIPLAEAAPESFLEALKTSIRSEDYCIKDLFNDGNSFFGECSHANLLWAIETISWSLDYLPKVSRILAELSKIDPGGTYSNRPFNSLKEIYLGWINNTKADHQTRIKIIDSNLMKFYPNVTWELLISLLPEKPSSISSGIKKPDYRDWAEGIGKEVNREDCYKYIEEISKRIIELMMENPEERLLKIVENITRLPKKYLNEVVKKILSLEVDNISNEKRLEIGNKLKDIISRHRKFKDAEWALPESTIEELLETYKYIIPEDLLLKHKYLFDSSFPNLINPISRKKSHQESQQQLKEYRIKKIKDIYKQEGIEGIEELAIICNYPRIIGKTIANSKLKDSFEKNILTWLESEKEELILLARAFVSVYARQDDKWVENLFEEFHSWNEDKIFNFLISLPFEETTFKMLNQTDGKIQEKYWKKINSYFITNENLENINWILENFFENNRFLAAVDVAHQALRESDFKISLNNELLVKVLNKLVFNLNKDKQTLDSSVQRDILKVIEYLQNEEDISSEDVARIEWTYISLFRFESLEPTYLEEEIKNNPSFFVQLVSWLYKPVNDKKEEEDLEESILEARAKNSWELLNIISVIPGQKQDNEIEFSTLKMWVDKARELFEKVDRKKIGEREIGKLLSSSPQGKDGIWPHESVRDIIEIIDSPEMKTGLENGKMNSRGTIGKEVYEGGKKERELADNYIEQAEELKLEWPVTASVLRQLAKNYNREAEIEDRRTELFD